jgi:sugar diacid utilization regulator
VGRTAKRVRNLMVVHKEKVVGVVGKTGEAKMGANPDNISK